MNDNRTTTQKVFGLMLAVFVGLAAITASATTYQYDDAGRLIKVVYDNGMESRYTYDDNGNLLSRSTDVINSVDENGRQVKTTVSPNPTSNEISVTVHTEDELPIEIRLITITGEVALTTQRYLQAGKCSVDVQHLATGAYQLHVKQGNRVSTTPVVINR